MVKKFIFSLIILIIAFNLVAAVDTNIKIKTLPNHQVSIFILEPNQVFNSLGSFHFDSDSEGYVTAKYTSSEVREIDLLINVKKENTKVFSEKFEGYKTGTPISIRIDNEAKDGHYNNPSNSTKELNQTNSTSDKKEAVKEESQPKEKLNISNNQPTTGQVISNGGSSYFSWAFYSIMGVILIGIVIVVFVWKFSDFRSGLDSPSHPKGLPPGASFKGEKVDHQQVNLSSNKDVLKLEKRLEEAQREIRILKGKDKIREVEKRLDEDRRELDKLRKGDY